MRSTLEETRDVREPGIHLTPRLKGNLMKTLKTLAVLLTVGLVSTIATTQALASGGCHGTQYSQAAGTYTSYCVYYWCDAEWHTVGTYSSRCEANRIALNWQSSGYRTQVVAHY